MYVFSITLLASSYRFCQHSLVRYIKYWYPTIGIAIMFPYPCYYNNCHKLHNRDLGTPPNQFDSWLSYRHRITSLFQVYLELYSLNLKRNTPKSGFQREGDCTQLQWTLLQICYILYPTLGIVDNSQPFKWL